MSRELPNRKKADRGQSEWRSKKDTSPLAGEDGQTHFDHPQSTTHHGSPLDRFLSTLRSNGYQPKRAGEGWTCRCPAHEDRNPSLSINTKSDGSVLVHCHAGCRVESVVDAVGLGMKDLFVDDAVCQNGRAWGRGVSGSSRVFQVKKPRSVSVTGVTDSVEGHAVDAQSETGFDDLDDAIGVYERMMGASDHRWEYHDAASELVGVVLRWDSPEGKQIRPVSLVDGLWRLRGMPSPRPLYGLSALIHVLDGSGQPVLVCEGEKAADAAIACGYIATTSPNGSKSAGKCDWSVLDGKHVVVVPDLDEAGEVYAADVVELCSGGGRGAASVRVVDLSEAWSGLESGSDLADVLALESGDTQLVSEKLDALIQQTEPEHTHSLGDAQSANNSERTARIYQPFPVDLLPEPVKSYITQGAKSIGCDPSYIALPVLSMLAGAIGNTHEVRLKNGWTEPCVVWSCIVGKSGTCKSPAIALAFKPLERIQERLFLEYQQELDSHKQVIGGAGGHEPVGGAGNGSVPRPSRCIIDDATIEATIELISNNPRGIVQKRDELASWFDFDRYSKGKSGGGGGAARWIELFHARPVSVDRKTSESIFVPRAALSISGGSQPGILNRLLTNQNLESGLIARFLFAMPIAPSKRWNNNEISPAVTERMYTLVEHLRIHTMCTAPPEASEEQPRPHVIDLDFEAKRAFGAFSDPHNESIQYQPEHIGAAWSKLECYVARFALIIHLVREAAGDPTLNDPEYIDVDSMNAAIGLVEWFKSETKRLYTILEMDAKELEDLQAVEWIIKKGGVVTVREFSRGLTQYKDSKKAQAKINELIEAGFGTYRGRKPSGRTQEFVLHAEYLSHTESITAQTPSDTSDTDTSAGYSPEKLHTVTGANGRYQVHSTGEDQ